MFEWVHFFIQFVHLSVRLKHVFSAMGMRLEPPGLFGPNKRTRVCLGPLFCLHRGLKAMNRRCLLTTHTWAPPSLGPSSVSSSPSVRTACFLFFPSLSSVSSPLLSQAVAWPTFTSPTLDPLMSATLALFTDQVCFINISHLDNPQSVYEYTFHKYDMKLMV